MLFSRYLADSWQIVGLSGGIFSNAASRCSIRTTFSVSRFSAAFFMPWTITPRPITKAVDPARHPELKLKTPASVVLYELVSGLWVPRGHTEGDVEQGADPSGGGSREEVTVTDLRVQHPTGGGEAAQHHVPRRRIQLA